jgi:hypothetical protein
MQYVIEHPATGELWAGEKGWQVPTSYEDIVNLLAYNGDFNVVERICREVAQDVGGNVIELGTYLADTDFYQEPSDYSEPTGEPHLNFTHGFQRHEEPRRLT